GALQTSAGGSAEGPAANDWPVWTGFVAILAALVLATVGGLIVDIPALLFGVKIDASHTPPGLELLDTVVQDLAFVVTVVLFARLGGRAVHSWQFGLRPTPVRRAAGLVVLTILGFIAFSVVWAVALDVSTKEKLLEQLGANETALLLALSALLTTVIAPICEEILFRGYIFAALSKWRGWLPAALITGVLFGGVHAGSAPVADLVPLGVLGFMLCMLYRRTGSLYPCIAAHSLNNSLAFGDLEGWGWQIPLLMIGALATIGLIWLLAQRIGLISAVPAEAAVTPTTYDHLYGP
ncbi:MAG TPA: type II CAAX endopeptidase family protein, partial [Solirubrobacteraceae bacterium]|nr:type II CAAX endopeptidase family protein [Solirubrobacteraceae bacterium]